MSETSTTRASVPAMSPTRIHSPVSKKSWRAPLVVLLALIAGTGFALAHHLLGTHLDRKPVADVLVSQAWISRISTALAFAVKVALAISVGTAYVQHQWLRFHDQSFQTKDVDALTSVLGNALSFTSSPVWLRHPLLTLMALISWGIPLATITAPGSLTVVPMSLDTTYVDINVPQLQFNNLSNYGEITIDIGAVVVLPRIYKLAYRAASAAQPVSIASSHPNETYHVDFHAPAIRCSPSTNDTWVRNITIEVARLANGGGGTHYISWTGGKHTYPMESLDYKPLDVESPQGSRISVVTTAGNSSTSYDFVGGWGGHNFPAPSTVQQLSVIECILHNASYSVGSNFQYPGQTHEIVISRWLNTVAAEQISLETHPPRDEIASYLTVMSAFGTLLVGTGFQNHDGVEETWLSVYNILDIDWADRKSLPRQLEQLFQNITLSLLSDTNLIKNSSVADPVNITVNTWPVTYMYTGADLLLAYGISILCTLVCAAVGFHAFFVNDASYQNMFSTFLRATNDLEIRSHISSGDTGCDPLPKPLAKTAVTLNGRNAPGGLYSVISTTRSNDLELQRIRTDETDTPIGHDTSVAHEVASPASSLAIPRRVTY